MDSPRHLEEWLSTLRERPRLHPQGWTTVDDLKAADSALAEHPTAVELWMLRGDFIQLCDPYAPDYPLDEALSSYQRAAELSPSRFEPLLRIGHFIDSVLDDPERAVLFFQKAVELGGGQKARDALAAAREQLKD